jgi:thiamine transport system permease protein
MLGLFWGVFFAYPLAVILHASLWGEGGWQLGGFRELMSDSYYREVLLFSLLQAGLSTAITLVLALGGAQVLADYDFPFKGALRVALALPFVLPTVVVATAWRALLGQERELLPSGHVGYILLAHVFYNYAVALRILLSFWMSQNPQLHEAAMLLGAGPWRRFWRITLPRLRPALLAAGALVFLFNFSSFGVILLLGGPDCDLVGLPCSSLEAEIYFQTFALFDLPAAAALALLQMSFTGLVLFFSARQHSQYPHQFTWPRQQPARPWPPFGPLWLWPLSQLGLMALLILAPLAALVWQSFTWGPAGPSLVYYGLLDEDKRGSRLFIPPLEAMQNSLEFALAATALALLLGTLGAYALRSARRPWLELLLMLPLTTSPVTLGLGYLLAFDSPPLNLRYSFYLIPLAHALSGFPFVLRVVLPSLQAIPPSKGEAARLLGAGWWRAWWRIERPYLGPAWLAGGIFAFLLSMGEFGLALFIADPQKPTLPLMIFRLLGLPGLANYGQALALSVILMGICGIGLWMAESFKEG